jgi:hypothetical protein
MRILNFHQDAMNEFDIRFLDEVYLFYIIFIVFTPSSISKNDP